MKLGAHVSIAGGLSKSVERAKAIGVGCLQIFASPPQSFRNTDYSDAEIKGFSRLVRENGLGPIFFHGVYLINLASQDERLYDLSIDSLTKYLRLCEDLPVRGVIFHVGSHKGKGFPAVKGRVIKAVEQILSRTKSGQLILENNAGQGGGLGSQFSEIGDIINYINSDRLAVCLDSQHAFAAGYDVSTSVGLEKTVSELDRAIGLKKLVSVHLNDSKVPLGSLRDRHENIGQGLIGLRALGRIVNHPKLSHLSFILEVPGFENKGPDKKNLDIVKGLIQV